MKLQTGMLFLLLPCFQGIWTVAALGASPKEAVPQSNQQDRWDAAYRDGRRAPWDNRKFPAALALISERAWCCWGV